MPWAPSCQNCCRKVSALGKAPEGGWPGAWGSWVLAWCCHQVLWAHQGSSPWASASCSVQSGPPALHWCWASLSLSSPWFTSKHPWHLSAQLPLSSPPYIRDSGVFRKRWRGLCGVCSPAAHPAVCSPIISFFQRKKNLPSQPTRPLMALLLGRHHRGHIRGQMALALTPQIPPSRKAAISTIMQVRYL